MYILLSLFYTTTYIKFPLFLHVWLVYVQHFLQYLYSSHPRHILFHYVIHGFSTVGLCCNIKLAIFTAQCYPSSKIPSLFQSNSNSVNLAPNHCHNITHKKRNVLARLKTGGNTKKRIMRQKETCVTPTLSFHTNTHTHTHTHTYAHARTHSRTQLQDEELFVSQSTSHYVFHKKSVGIPLIKLSDIFVDFQISLRTKIFFSWTWSMFESYFDHGSVT